MSEKQHHYFASCALGWSTADTREEAVKKLCRYLRSEIRKEIKARQKKGDGGAYLWSCRIDQPKDAAYKISFYSPDCPWHSGRHHEITYMAGNNTIYFTTSRDTLDTVPVDEDDEQEKENAA